ncbi:Dyp-type peroxidase [Actinomadura macra]|uniref:Dyp-type peroxidase n=1 Tax=Actinomadura macra TaxID=46164 RepID=UPI00083192B2|nr:Dyp-type peroxidase [Actinomadura macra]
MAQVHGGPPQEPVLDADEIQGNVVPGFLKPHMAVTAFTITDAAAARRWFAEIAPRVTTLGEVMETRVKVRRLRGFTAARRLETLGAIPDDVDDAWFNIAVGRQAMTRLLADGPYAKDMEAFEDEGFVHGLAARSSLLGDPTDPSSEGNPANWRLGGPRNEADVLLVFNADRREACLALRDELRRSAEASGLRCCYDEEGAKFDDIGAEHFGYQDGVSQPGVRGRYADDPDAVITPRQVDPNAIPDAWLFGLPGQYLVWPGEFVFGYPRSAADPLMPGQINMPGPKWCRNGSYLVFRRLRQDVPAFRAFVQEQAERLSKEQGFEHVTPEWLGARIVGRWTSGAPVSRLPDKDDVALGVDRLANNNFGFAGKGGPPPRDGDDGWPVAEADPVGLICPMAAHIRKVNTRATPNDLGGRRASFSRRILRRGLPYGPPYVEHDPGTHDMDRGLLFMSYQSSISDQFEFLNARWMGSPTAPRSPSGHDMFIGQNGEPGQNRRRTSVLFGTAAKTATLSTVVDWVIPTGGGYFFTPSISTLRTILGGS